MAQRLNILPRPARRPRLTRCALLEGDADDWIACCSHRLLPLSQRTVQDETLAEDTLQISWIKVLQSLHRAHFQGPVACRWVGAIVANTAKDIRRQRQRRGEVPLIQPESPERSPEEVIQERRRVALVREAISQLPKAYRQVIDLRMAVFKTSHTLIQALHVPACIVA